MKIPRTLTTAATTASLLIFGPLLTAQEGDLLFQDDFNTDSSSNWAIVTNAPAENNDWEANFSWDYSQFGIPPSPNSTASTLGLQFRVNKIYGLAYSVTGFPNGQTFEGDYVLKFDLWLNFNADTSEGGAGIGPTMPAGGGGSTEYASFGVGASGSFANHPFLSDSEGPFFAMNADGGSGFDYRVFVNGISQAPSDGAYLAGTNNISGEGGSRRWSEPYYHTAVPGGATVPFEQLEMYSAFEWNIKPPEQYELGETANGVPGFVWHEVAVEVRGDIVRWYLNDLLLAELTPENAEIADGVFGAVPTSGNIAIGYTDSFSSLAAFESHFSFAVYDNVRVYTLPPEAAGFASWAVENIADENARGPLDNPSGDGINNLLKYALGLNPAVADRSGLPLGVFEDDGGQNYLTLTAAKNPDATDVQLLVEVSGDLTTWNSGSGHTTVLVDDGTTLKVRDNTALSAAGRRFIRLNAALVE